MKIVFIKRSLLAFSLLCTSAVFAQDKPLGSETVIVVKPYTPSVNDAFKIKETPTAVDSVSLEKKPIKYSIFSFPVASTFSPIKARATTVERERPVKVFDNYATLGFGTYATALAEFYSNFEVSKTDNFGIFLTHNSSQGGIEDAILDDKFYNTELNLNYNSRNKNNFWKTEVGLQHQLSNWYGLPSIANAPQGLISNIDPAQQNYYSAYVGGELEFYDSFFDKASTRYRFFGDAFDSAEHHFKTDANFEVNIADELISTKIIADVVSGSFDREYATTQGIDYNLMNFGLSPSLLILRDDLSLNLGASFFYAYDAENSNSSFYIFPQVNASYRVGGDYFIAYAGLEGGLKQNTYFQFVQINPFVSPTLGMRPTDMPYDAFLGAKGKLSNSIAYNVRGSYMAEHNKPLFLANLNTPLNSEKYAYGNSFGVVYDDITTASMFAEISVDVNRNFKLGISGTYYNYSTDLENEAWNLPEYEASLMADYQITEKWFAGANLFFIGERKDRMLNLISNTPTTVTLDSFMDLNANVGYRFNDQLSIFARGNNLLNNSYQRWSNFPVQGIQVLAGATYKFDF